MRTWYWNRYDPSRGELRSGMNSLRTWIRIPRVVASLIRTPRVLVSVICKGLKAVRLTLEVARTPSLIMSWPLI